MRPLMLRHGRRPLVSGQALMEYMLIISMVVLALVAAFKLLRPVYSKFIAERSKALQENFSKGVYRFRFPGR